MALFYAQSREQTSNISFLLIILQYFWYIGVFHKWRYSRGRNQVYLLPSILRQQGVQGRNCSGCLLCIVTYLRIHFTRGSSVIMYLENFSYLYKHHIAVCGRIYKFLNKMPIYRYAYTAYCVIRICIYIIDIPRSRYISWLYGTDQIYILLWRFEYQSDGICL